MSGRPIDPVDVAVEMLTAELPGFESRFVAVRDAVGIRGALPIGAELSREMVMYPIYSARPIFPSDLERMVGKAIEAGHATPAELAIADAKERERIKRELAPVIEHVTSRIRQLAIEAVGLEAVIREREHRAIEAGRREGDAIGYARGIREGRAAGIRSVVEAMLTHSAEVGEAVDTVRESWRDDLDDE